MITRTCPPGGRGRAACTRVGLRFSNPGSSTGGGDRPGGLFGVSVRDRAGGLRARPSARDAPRTPRTAPRGWGGLQALPSAKDALPHPLGQVGYVVVGASRSWPLPAGECHVAAMEGRFCRARCGIPSRSVWKSAVRTSAKRRSKSVAASAKVNRQQPPQRARIKFRSAKIELRREKTNSAERDSNLNLAASEIG